MAWRLQEYVTRGEIDNRTRGCVTGRIWLAGVNEPLVLELEGNCHPDLAGCLLTFQNPTPTPLSTRPPAFHQRGRPGDMTASRKLHVPDVPIEEFIHSDEKGQSAPESLANYLYLEWFSECSGRMVIESADFELQISTPEWRLQPEDTGTTEHTDKACPSFLETPAEDVFFDASEDGEDQRPWDEFRHEQALRERDALTDKFGKLFDKYRDHPDRDRIIAREMGWDWLEETADEEDEGGEEGERSGSDFQGTEAEDLSDLDAGDWVKPEPDPTREGIDWIRTPDGEIRHPLYDRAFHLTADLNAFCRMNGLEEEADADLDELFSSLGLLAAKLAGALTDLADGTNLYEPGFVVALLKRALEILNHALAALAALEPKSLLPVKMIARYCTELLSIREEMLKLIQEFRRRIS